MSCMGPEVNGIGSCVEMCLAFSFVDAYLGEMHVLRLDWGPAL